MVKIESLKTTEKRKGQRIPLFQQCKPNCVGYRGEKKLLLTMLSLKKPDQLQIKTDELYLNKTRRDLKLI